VLLHQLGEDLLLDPELLLQGSDLAVLDLRDDLAAFAGLLQGRGPVFEKLLLPTIEQVGLDPEWIAHIGNRFLLQ
jgi:hypothetical protein